MHIFFNHPRIIISYLLFICLFIPFVFAEDELPSVQAILSPIPPTIDGLLNEPVWQSAAILENFRQYQTGKPINEKTIAYVLYDKKNLYFGFKCYESQMEKTMARISTENGPAYMDDCVEIFISPYEVADPNNYYHFVTNIIGTKYSWCLYDPSHTLKWKAKTARQKDGWTAEIVIPFSTLVQKGKNEAYWRLNVGREEQPSNEISSWSVTRGSFHSPYRFGFLKGIDLDGKFIGLRNLITPSKNTTALDQKTPVKNIFDMDKAMIPAERPVVVIPQPVKMKFTKTAFPINPRTRIIVGDSPSKENMQAAREINEELMELTGIKLPIVQYSRLKNKVLKNCIVLGEPETNPAVAQLVKALKLKVNPKTPGPEGYILQSTNDFILIAGSDKRGTYYGIQSLKQLIEPKPVRNNTIASIPGVNIWDKPYFPIRSVHILIDKESSWVHKKMIEKIFARFKYNHLIIESEQGIAWKSRPEIVSTWAIEPTEVKKLVKIADDHLMQVTPLIQSLGHGEWMFRNGNNLEFTENTTKPDVYCPMNPKSYEFIFAIMDEAIEIFNHPEYLHIGHDEHDMFSEFPYHEECKKIGNETLYYMDTLKLYDYLKSKGIKTMMWTDILLKDSFRPKISELPNDIVMADWHYGPNSKYPSVDFFQKNGFEVLGCTWFDPKNIQRFSEYGGSQKILGMMQTTWAGYHQNDTILEREFHQVMAYITAADCFWNPMNRNLEKLPYNAGEVLMRVWEKTPDTYETNKGFSVNLDKFTNITISDDKKSGGFLGYGEGNDLSSITKNAKNQMIHLWDNILYRISLNNNNPGGILLKGNGITSTFPEKVKNIRINRKATKLCFLHTTAYPSLPGIKAGHYLVYYQDGNMEKIDLIYRKNIGSWLDQETSYMGKLAWQGITVDNQSIYFRPLHWDNPHPEKTIQSIDFINGDAGLSPILLAITGIQSGK